MPGKLIVDEIEDSGGNSVIGRKNFIINGGMLVSQRGTSFASPSSTDYTLDRWQNTYSQDTGATTISQSTTTPDFFGSSLKIDCTTAETSVDASNYWVLRHNFEGQDLQNLGYGTSNAKTITISFWVYSTKTGTFAVSLYNADAAYSYVADVTVDSASTWEYKTVTIAGDTSNGFDNDNARSLILNITLNAGSTFQTTAGSWTSGAYFGTSSTDNFLDNTSNDFYITGVQMEVGSVATNFEIRPIGEELALCERYFQIYIEGTQEIMTGGYYTGSIILGAIHFPTMRDEPSISVTSGTNYYRFWRNNAGDDFDDFSSVGSIGKKTARLQTNTGVSGTSGHAGTAVGYNANSKITLDAEL